MLTLLLLLMPTTICMIFCVKFATSKNIHKSRYLLMSLSFVAALYFFSDATYYSAYKDYKALVFGDIIGTFSGVALPSLVMLVLRSMVYEKYTRWYSYITLLVIPCILGTMTLTVYLMMGFDESEMYLRMLDEVHPSSSALMSNESRGASVHFWVNIIAYYGMMLCLGVCLLWQVTYYMKRTHFKFGEIREFLFNRGEIEPFHLEGVLFASLFVIFLLRIGISRAYIVHHQSVALMFALTGSVLVWMVFKVASYIDYPTITLFDNHARNVQPLPDVVGIKDSADDSLAPVSYIDMAETEDEDMLLSSLKVYMSDDKPFLSPTLTIEDVAHALCTNKSYVSKCVNKNLHQTFRDYVNSLRIDYAKQMMLSHPDMVQEEIASKSGFSEASQFNKKFKQMVGMTPRQWMLGQGDVFI